MLVVGVESGGMITGLAKTLKAKIPGLKVVGVEPEHSSVQDGVTRTGAWKVEDIGGNFTPSILDKSLIDEWIQVADQESYSTARQLIREEGVFCGMYLVPALPNPLTMESLPLLSMRLSSDSLISVHPRSIIWKCRVGCIALLSITGKGIVSDASRFDHLE